MRQDPAYPTPAPPTEFLAADVVALTLNLTTGLTRHPYLKLGTLGTVRGVNGRQVEVSFASCSLKVDNSYLELKLRPSLLGSGYARSAPVAGGEPKGRGGSKVSLKERLSLPTAPPEACQTYADRLRSLDPASIDQPNVTCGVAGLDPTGANGKSR